MRNLLPNDGALLPRLSERDFGIRSEAEQLLLTRQVVTLPPPATAIRPDAQDSPSLSNSLYGLSRGLVARIFVSESFSTGVSSAIRGKSVRVVLGDLPRTGVECPRKPSNDAEANFPGFLRFLAAFGT